MEFVQYSPDGRYELRISPEIAKDTTRISGVTITLSMIEPSHLIIRYYHELVPNTNLLTLTYDVTTQLVNTMSTLPQPIAIWAMLTLMSWGEVNDVRVSFPGTSWAYRAYRTLRGMEVVDCAGNKFIPFNDDLTPAMELTRFRMHPNTKPVTVKPRTFNQTYELPYDIKVVMDKSTEDYVVVNIMDGQTVNVGVFMLCPDGHIKSVKDFADVTCVHSPLMWDAFRRCFGGMMKTLGYTTIEIMGDVYNADMELVSTPIAAPTVSPEGEKQSVRAAYRYPGDVQIFIDRNPDGDVSVTTFNTEKRVVGKLVPDGSRRLRMIEHPYADHPDFQKYNRYLEMALRDFCMMLPFYDSVEMPIHRQLQP